MLVLTRRCNQGIVIDDHVEISVLSIVGDKVRIGIQAPRHVSILRKEVYTRLHDMEVEIDNSSADGAEHTGPSELLDGS